MALHFVQVEREFIEGPEPDNVAAALRIPDPNTVIGMAVRMWTWSLDYAAPDGVVFGDGAATSIERAAGWRGKRGRWVEEMVRSGVLETSSAGVRFCGWTERYGRVLSEKERSHIRKRRQRSKSLEGQEEEKHSGRNVTRDITGDKGPEGGTKERDIPPDCFSRDRPETGEVENLQPPPEPAVVVGAAPGEFPPTENGCWRWIQSERAARGLAPEPSPPKAFPSWHDAALVEVGPGGIQHAYWRYLEDPDFERKEWPTAVFITPGVFGPRKPARGTG